MGYGMGEETMRLTLVERFAPCLLCFGLLVSPCPAEVSIGSSSDSGSADSLVLMYLLTGGGDDPDPWPIARLHIPGAWALNADGSEGATPSGWPSLGWDPVADTAEVVWSRHDGSDYEIVISSWQAGSWTEPAALTDNATDDRKPELAYAPDGTARVTFWRDGDVYWVSRPARGSWSSPELVDAGTDSSVGSSAEDLVAYQQPASPSGTDVLVAERISGGDWSPTFLAHTPFEGFEGTGDLDVRLHARTGRVWIDWEDGAGRLGWCRQQAGGGWSAPDFETISGPEDEEAGRMRIRAHVLSTP